MNSKYILLLIILSILCLLKADDDEYHCVMYDTCATIGIHNQNCPVNHTAKSINDEEAARILRKRCGWLFPSDDTPVCCSAQQVIDMDAGLQKGEGVFGRCQTCSKNMELSVCAFTCAPDQSRFLIAYPSFDGSYVEAIDYRIDYNHMEGVFNSCKEVVLPSTGKKAMDVSCGYWEDKCDPEKWYEFIGNAVDNPLVPFNIRYIVENNETIRFEHETKKCSEAYNNSYACSCVDCDESCPAGQSPDPVDPGFQIAGLNGVTFIISISVGVFGLFLLGASLYNGSTLGIPEFPNILAGIDSVNIALTIFFGKWGSFCARQPILILAVASWCVAGLIFGVQYLEITVDPVELWAAPNSRSRQEKDYFDSRFGPFYRTTQIFIKPVNMNFIFHETSQGNETFGPAFNQDFLYEVFKLQEEIENIGQAEGAGLDKICFAPMTLAGEDTKLSECTVQSIFGYFQNDYTKFNETTETEEGFTKNYLDVIRDCTKNAYWPDCMGLYKGPIEPAIALGGFPKSESNKSPDYRLASAVVLTFIIQNHMDKSKLEPALAWEKKFMTFMETYTNEMMDVAYIAERSIEDGIKDMSDAEAYTVVISYLVMFLYITVSLGRIRSINILKESKIVLGISGICIVLISVFCSLGVFGYLKVATTMLTIEVIPFLVLAVGVDNIFMLVHAFNRVDRIKYEKIHEAIGKALGEIGPSILLTTASGCCCFGIGGLSDMPAVKTFALYATVALFVDFLLQITAFVALLSISQHRYEQGRLDLLCCFKTSKPNNEKHSTGFLQKIFEKYYAPFLMQNKVRHIIMAIFLIWSCLSLMILPNIELGLDQELSMPKDSHLVKYFRFMAELLSMGPPVYWVIGPGLNYTKTEHQNLICGGILCNNDSVQTQLYIASNYPEITRIARSSNSWLDDYIDWLSIETCCRQDESGNFCQSEDKDCNECPVIMQEDGIRPPPTHFEKYLEFFLLDLPTDECAKAGRAAYSTAINYVVDGNDRLNVMDSYFMSYHTTLTTSKDFYEALQEARKISDGIEKMLKDKNFGDIKVFPYSIFYVYYEQYLTIWHDTLVSIAYSLLAIFLVTFVLMGLDIISAFTITFMVFLIVLNMGSLMWLWNISLNAVSLVNLVMSIGIGVEFISHTVRSYKINYGTRIERATIALSKTGSSVLSGITLTKFAGIVVLAFAKSQIFQIFYFRMYLGIVLIGAAHGLILLPVYLTYIGPPSHGRSKPEENNNIHNHNYSSQNGNTE